MRTYAAVLGQPGPDERDQASRDLYTRLTEEVQLRTSVPAGTVVGKVLDALGSGRLARHGDGRAERPVERRERDPRHLVHARRRARRGRDRRRTRHDGPLDAATVDVQLQSDIEPPSPWWRLTHPLDLFGLND